MSIKKINILTPYRKGGPWFWGETLVNKINRSSPLEFQGEHIYKLFDLLSSPIYQDCDIVHAAVPISYRLWRKPVILTVKGNYLIENNIWKPFFPKAIDKADIVTTPSQYLKEEVGFDKAIVIPNAIDINKFTITDLQDREDINIITMTKFYFEDKARGVLTILKILNELPEPAKKRINYYILGKGKFLENIIKESWKFSVKHSFVGWQDPQIFFSKSDLFLYYSEHDNMPNAVLEAMASGLPVITNQVGAVREMIDNKQDGFIAQNEEEYRNHFLSLIENFSLRKQIGQRARKKIEERFNWDVIIWDYIKLYRSLR